MRNQLRTFFRMVPVGAPAAAALAYVPWVMVSRALAFLRTLLVARLLGEAGKEAFGLYQPALELINLLVALVMFGAADVAERYVARVEHEHGQAGVRRWLARQWTRVGLSGVAAIALLGGLSPWLSPAVWGQRRIALAVLCGVAVLALALYQHVAAVLRGLRSYGAAAGMELIAAILLLILSAAASLLHSAAALVGGYALSVAIPLLIYGAVVWRFLGAASQVIEPADSTPRSLGDASALSQPASAITAGTTHFAAWSLVRLLLVMAFGFLSIWGVRFLSDQGIRHLTSSVGGLGVREAGQFAMPLRIAQLMGFLAVTAWASSYGIAARAWSQGRVRRARVQFFRVGKFGAAGSTLIGVGLLLCRGVFAWVLPVYAESINRLLPGMIALFLWYGMVAFLSSFCDLREKPQRGAFLWGTAVLVQGVAIGVAWHYRWNAMWLGVPFEPQVYMLLASAGGLAAALALVAPWLVCWPLRFSATGVPLVILGVVPVTLFCPGWVVDGIAVPAMLGAMGFLWMAGLLIRPVDRRGFRRWKARKSPRGFPVEAARAGATEKL